jgi:hypothetical protein
MSKKVYEQMTLFDGPFVNPLPEPKRGRKRKSESAVAKANSAQTKKPASAGRQAETQALPLQKPKRGRPRKTVSAAEKTGSTQAKESASAVPHPEVPGIASAEKNGPLEELPITKFPGTETFSSSIEEPQSAQTEPAMEKPAPLEEEWAASEIAAAEPQTEAAAEPSTEKAVEIPVSPEEEPAAEAADTEALQTEDSAEKGSEEPVEEPAPMGETESHAEAAEEPQTENISNPGFEEPVGKSAPLEEDWSDSDINAGPAFSEERDSAQETAQVSPDNPEDVSADGIAESESSDENLPSSPVPASQEENQEEKKDENAAEILDDQAPSSELPGPEPSRSTDDAKISSVPEQPWTVSNILEGYSTAQSQEERDTYVHRLEDMGDKGDAQACLILGLNYDPYRHKGFHARSEETSLHWYTKSADLGNARAANEAAILFYRGTPVVRNRELAIRYAETAVSLAPENEVFAKNLSIIKSGPYRDRYTTNSRKNPDEILLQGKAKKLTPFNITYTSLVALIAVICTVTGAISLGLLAYPVAGLLLLQLLINYAISKCKVIIASGYITGQCSFHRDVCIPMKCIRAVGTSVFGGIKVSAANVNAVFYMLENDDEIYNTLCEMIISSNS